MKDAIGYLRVSTKEQGRSGLGLAAQRHDIEAFGEREASKSKPGIRTFRPVQARTRFFCVPHVWLGRQAKRKRLKASAGTDSNTRRSPPAPRRRAVRQPSC